MKRKRKFNNNIVRVRDTIFKSNLEKYCAKVLDENGIPYQYEKHSFEVFPKVIYPS